MDQRVLLLKKGNDIEESTVFDELGKYNKETMRNREWIQNEDHYKDYPDFKSAGAVIITNAQTKFGKRSIKQPERSLKKFSLEALPKPARKRIYQQYLAEPSLGPSQPSRSQDSSETTFASIAPKPPPKPIVIRKDFPETWIFDSFDFNSS